MLILLLQLCLCAVTVIQLTSSQSTYDVADDVTSCDSSESSVQMLRQLVDAVSQLQRDVAELKAPKVEQGKFCFTYNQPSKDNLPHVLCGTENKYQPV